LVVDYSETLQNPAKHTSWAQYNKPAKGADHDAGHQWKYDKQDQSGAQPWRRTFDYQSQRKANNEACGSDQEGESKSTLGYYDVITVFKKFSVVG
jgi:hypothetical protein